MRYRFWHPFAALTGTLAAVLLSPLIVDAQSPSAVSKSTLTTGSATRGRTPDGQPDLQGVWTNANVTPLERPTELGEKQFYTEQELVEVEKRAHIASNPEDRGGPAAHYDLAQFGLDRSQGKLVLSHRTSLIIDPPNGRIPSLTAEAQKRAADRAEAAKRSGPFDGPENRPLGERCILWSGEGPPMLPEAYNSNLQIQQGPGYVAILQEMIHDVRIIPLDRRPHLGPNIRQYLGDSRGRWEGNTLIVDTTNFTEKTNFKGASGNLHVVERFTRLDENTILYEFALDDPTTWVRPWKGELRMTKTQGPVFEYACHEGNYGLANTLSGARASEKAAESKKNSKPD